MDMGIVMQGMIVCRRGKIKAFFRRDAAAGG
jgi:hypothetical protein